MPDNERFSGRTVLVVGGARGMGAAQVRRCHSEGGSVVIADIRAEEGEELARSLGERAIFATLDVSAEAGWAPVLEASREAFGSAPDVLLYNAGIARPAPLQETSLEDFQAVIDVNLVGVFLGIRSVIPGMVSAGRGSIVVISSLDAHAAHPLLGSYCASKSGVLGLVRVAAIELAAHGIRANALAPGVVDTPMMHPPDERVSLDGWAQQVPLGRVGQPEDIAGAALFLASDDASFITGTHLNIDGGVFAQVPLFDPNNLITRLQN